LFEGKECLAAFHLLDDIALGMSDLTNCSSCNLGSFASRECVHRDIEVCKNEHDLIDQELPKERC